MAAVPSPTSPAAKHEAIARLLRRDIVRGQLTPGTRLPPQRKLLRRFDASLPTVQRAIGVLQRDGFIVGRGRSGTFVTDQPPHLTQYTLLFDCWPNSAGRWSRFLTALAQQALSMNRGEHKIGVHHGVHPQDNPRLFRQIEADVVHHRVAGLIFTNAVHPFANTALLDEPDVPRVAIQMASSSPDVKSVYPDWTSFFARAMDEIVARGYQRLAVMVAAGFDKNGPLAQTLRELVQARGLQLPDRWMQALHTEVPTWAGNYVQLLASVPATDRPQALLIADEHFSDDAVAGLYQAGVHPGRDLHVLAHCSFPAPTAPPPGLRRMGFNTRDVVLACLKLIDRMRVGEPVEMHTHIPAVFEDELPSNG